MTTSTFEAQNIDDQKNSADQSSALQILRNSKMLQFLTALLLVQLLVAAYLAISNSRTSDFAASEPVFSIATDAISVIEIDDGEANVKLQRNNDQWYLGEDKTYPVEQSRIDTLLTSLSGIRSGLPIANSVESRKQLQVADDDYQRKLVATDENNESTTLLLGTSPGLRKAHLRRQESDDIYSASLPVSDVSASADQWLDKSLLKLEDITQITSEDVTFKREGSDKNEQWIIADASETEKVDSEKLTAAINSLQNLTIRGIATPDSNESATDSDENSEVKTSAFTATSAGMEYQFTLTGNAEKATVSRDDIDGSFSISTSVFDTLTEFAQRSAWVLPEQAEGQSETEAEIDTPAEE